MLMMRRNIKLQPSRPRLPSNTHNIIRLLLGFFVALILRLLLVNKLPLQSRNNILNPGLALLKREIPAPVPPPRFSVRLQRRPLPQRRELRVAELV
jgi:hypothetical protein